MVSFPNGKSDQGRQRGMDIQEAKARRKFKHLVFTGSIYEFFGRLATYRCDNMDQVTALALAEADKLTARYGSC